MNHLTNTNDTHEDAERTCRACGRSYDGEALDHLPLFDTIERVAVRVCSCGAKLGVQLCETDDCPKRGVWIFDTVAEAYCAEHAVERFTNAAKGGA